MKIERHGSGAFHGVTSAEFNSPKFSWHASSSSFHIKQSRVRDFSTHSRHDYVVSLSVEELVHLIKVAADAAMQDPAAFAPDVAKAVISLAQLQAVGTGVLRT